jgi:hypothetical protein
LLETLKFKPSHREQPDPSAIEVQACYNLRMTFMTVTYELQNPLGLENYRALGKFANTYGLKRFRVDEKRNWLHFDYDASRLEDSVVQHVLREAKIPVVREVPREEVQ